MGEVSVAARPDLSASREIRLSARNTTIAFRVRWLGAITVCGQFTEVAGTIRIPPAGLEHASVEVDVGTASVRTGNRLRDRHLRGRRFLDAARFPLITFRAERAAWRGASLMLPGALTVRGIMRFTELACRFEEPLAVDERAAAVRATGVAALRRRDFAVGSPLGRLSRDPRFRIIGDAVCVTVSVQATVPGVP